MRPASVAEPADRLRHEAWIAWVREAAQLPGVDLLIAAPTREVGARSVARVAFGRRVLG